MELTGDQCTAVDMTDRNVIVSAGAGTGKTAVLVARFVNLVRSGLAEVNQILTITFTEKAAEEMKQRIANEFHQLRMRNEKTAVETSYISTIHSFCSRLIKENPFVAGVDPEFEVMDEIDRRLMLGELLDKLFAEGGDDFLELVEHYGERAISRAIITYMDLCRSLGRESNHVESVLAEPEILTRKVEAAADERVALEMRELQEAVDALSCLKASGSCEKKRQQVVALRDSLYDMGSFRTLAEAMSDVTARMPTVPKDGNNRSACFQVREQLSRIRSILKQEQAAIFFDREPEEMMLPCKVALLKGVLLLWRKYEQRKKEGGVLDYEDLQLIARSLLRDNPSVRREYTQRFHYVLVDEFQDVNSLQKELVGLLSSGRNLFAVGDTCQSIYGFRNADVEIFAEMVDKCRLSPRTYHSVYLSDNFRSAPNLIRFLNFFFSSFWGRRGLRSDTSRTFSAHRGLPRRGSEFHPLRYARKEGGQPPPALVEIMLFQKVGAGHRSGENSEQVREREARSVAVRIAGAVANGEIMVYDPAVQKNRPVTYGDVAVLCRTRASYSAYSRALTELGVPFCTVGGQGFYERQEVSDLINLLRVVDNPFRDIPLVAVLRSPFVGVGDDTLFLLRRHVENRLDSPYVMEALRESGSIPGISGEDKEKLLRFLEILDNLRGRKDSMPVHQLVKTALASTRYVMHVLTSPEGIQKAANVSKFVDILREYEQREPAGIGGFLRFYEIMRHLGPQEEEAPLEAFWTDAVKLMTIHAAKGLEFPVVVVADMARWFNFDTDKFLVSGTMEIACNAWQESSPASFGRRLVFEERKEKQLAEEGRLLYVAMTRARDHLILAGGYRPDKQCDIEKAKSPMDWLLAILGGETDLPEPGTSCEVQLGEASVRICVDVADDSTVRATAGTSLIERYREHIRAGKRIPVPEASAERLLPEVKKLLGKIDSRPAAEPLSPPAEITVSQLTLFEECPYKFFLQEMMSFPDREVMAKLGGCREGASEIEERPPGTRIELPFGVGKRVFGQRIHACLEQLDLRVDQPQDLSKGVGRFFPSQEEACAAQELIQGFLRSEEARQLREAKELHREVAVKTALENVIISGVIDVLYLDEKDRWSILDFKSGLLQPEDAVQGKTYDFQMLLYAFLAGEAMGAQPEKAILYFLGSGASRSIPTGEKETERTRRRIAEIISAIGEGEFGRTSGPQCGQCEYVTVCSRPGGGD